MFQLPQRLPGIRRDHINHFIKSHGRPVPFLLRGRNLNTESRLHGQVADLSFHQFLQGPPGFAALLRQRPRPTQIIFLRFAEFIAKLAQNFVFVLHFGKLAAYFGAELDHLIQRGPILAFQTLKHRQPVFHLRQVLGRRLNAPRVIAQSGADILHADARRIERRQGFLELGLVPG